MSQFQPILEPHGARNSLALITFSGLTRGRPGFLFTETYTYIQRPLYTENFSWRRFCLELWKNKQVRTS